MAIGVRTRDLRKVYSASPPLAAGGSQVGRADAKDGKQPKAQIPPLDGLSLEILPGEISGPTGNGQVCTSLRYRVFDHAVPTALSYWKYGTTEVCQGSALTN